MNILFVNPNLLVQENDPFTTGIIYMPMGLAYAAAAARSQGHQVTVIDAFAQKPKQVRKRGAFYYFGLTEDEITDQIPTDSDLVVVYAINLTNHNSTVSIIQTIKHKFPEISVAVLENSQAVTAYSLHSSAVLTVFQKAGADYFLINDGDYKLLNLIKAIEDHDVINLEAYCLVKKQAKTETIANLDALPFPAWDLFPLENYWGLRFAHGPVASQKYLPLLTSRGCPYPCRFCVVPTTNNQKWRARSAKNVVDEIEYWQKTYGVNEFHWEDLDPTVSDKRTGEICEEIINRGLNISWKLVSGTKVE
ncbi:MAG: hypothetical protein KC733_10045, partial [Candidatus Omnitrophica bacterium]|nr:hypothetical protein [Candidatus Omnitrophota bacterium]